MKASVDSSRVFNQLQPACAQLLSAPTCGHVQQLQQRLQPLDAAVLQPLQPYLLFPALQLLQTPRDERLTTATLEMVTTVLERTCTDGADMALSLLQRMFLLLGAGPDQPATASEELQLAVVRCGHQLFLSCDSPTLALFYTDRGRLMLGHAVFQLVTLVKTQQNRALRLAAMDCLLACAGGERRCGAGPASEEARRRSSRVFVALLPGVLSALHAVYAGDWKQGQRVVSRALDVWTWFVCHVISDTAVALDKQTESEEPPSESGRLPSLTRTDVWLRTVAEKVSAMLTPAVALSGHHAPAVRRALLRLASSLLTQCAGTLPDSAPPLLRLMVLLSCDELPELRRAAAAELRQLRTAGLRRPLLEAAEEELYSLLSRLPTAVRAGGGDGALQLRLLHGYLRLLGPRLRQLTASAAHVHRLVGCLTQVAELRQDSSLVLYSAAGHRPLHGQQTQPIPEFKRFRYMDEDGEMWRHVCAACRLLGCHGDGMTLLELLTAAGTDEAWLLWSQVLLGQEPQFLSAESGAPVPELAQQLDVTPLLEMLPPSQPWRRRCVALEAVSAAARVAAGRCAALPVLTLCPVLEAAGGDEPLVVEVARAALTDLAGTHGVPALLRAHAGRLAVHVRRRLWTRGSQQSAAPLVAALIQGGGPEMLPYLEDTVRAVMRALDEDYEHCGAACLRALRRTVDAIAEWYPPPADPPPSAEEASPVPAVDRLLAHHRRQVAWRQEMAEAEAQKDEPLTDCPAGDADQPPADAEPEKPPVPAHLALVRDVVLQAAHFLDCDSLPVQVEVLSTVSVGSRLLAPLPDELLPLAARCWPPLLRCCRSQQPLLMRHALGAVRALAAAAGDFLRPRVCEGPLRPLLQWLRAAADGPAPPAGSQASQLQMACLTSLGDVAVRLRLPPPEMQQLAATATTYLSSRQPPALRAAARGLLVTAARHNSDAVWLELRRAREAAGSDPALRGLTELMKVIDSVCSEDGAEKLT